MQTNEATHRSVITEYTQCISNTASKFKLSKAVAGYLMSIGVSEHQQRITCINFLIIHFLQRTTDLQHILIGESEKEDVVAYRESNKIVLCQIVSHSCSKISPHVVIDESMNYYQWIFAVQRMNFMYVALQREQDINTYDYIHKTKIKLPPEIYSAAPHGLISLVINLNVLSQHFELHLADLQLSQQSTVSLSCNKHNYKLILFLCDQYASIRLINFQATQ